MSTKLKFFLCSFVRHALCFTTVSLIVFEPVAARSQFATSGHLIATARLMGAPAI